MEDKTKKQLVAHFEQELPVKLEEQKQLLQSQMNVQVQKLVTAVQTQLQSLAQSFNTAMTQQQTKLLDRLESMEEQLSTLSTASVAPKNIQSDLDTIIDSMNIEPQVTDDAKNKKKKKK